MEMSGFRPESHVAQQSRREKLRVQHQTSHHHNHHHNLDTTTAFPNHLEQHFADNIVQVRNVRNSSSANLLYDPSLFSSEMLDFSRNANVLQLAAEAQQHPNSSWRNSHSNIPQQSLDWMVNPAQLYHNTLDDVVTASARNQGIEISSLANELVLLPSFVNQSPAPPSGYNSTSVGAAASGSWIEQDLRNVSNPPQGLSLSLCSNPHSKIPSTTTATPRQQHFGDGCEDLNESKAEKSGGGYLCSIPKPSIISRGGATGKSLQDIVGISGGSSSNNSNSNNVCYRNTTGPLGPFTGYATILKSSKFLRPAQQLLDELCCVTDSKRFETCGGASERMSGEVSVSDAVNSNAIETEIVGRGGGGGNNNYSSASSSAFYASNEISRDIGCVSSESFRPEYQQKKAKLLYMQEEVCRRHKQYHQQMQMVVSSFESVAGLSASTPYISLALKTVAKHFRCLKNVITDQLRHIRKALGEDLSGTSSSSKGETNMRLKYMEQSFQKHKSSGVNVGFPEPQQQHIWRPQRGLPERSVAILRAWLFEHFLHPYPTDTDKHMLATQTGLSRNQVSNWFINARVRVWKPMVEEIHMLETKGIAEVDQSIVKRDGNSAIEGTSRTHNDSNKLVNNVMPNKQLDSSTTHSSLGNVDGSSGEQHGSNQEKRSRLECQDPTSMVDALAGFVPYQRSGLEVGGLGAVSLTLGLRHGVESAQQQQQQEQLRQQEDQLRRQLGGQMIHDFVG